MSGQPRIEYVEARRVLLDALTALQPHIRAIVLIGAQAVYLRTAGRLSTYQPFTTDADLALDPALLADIPLLGHAMLNAGFELTAEPGIWQQRFQRPKKRNRYYAVMPRRANSMVRRRNSGGCGRGIGILLQDDQSRLRLDVRQIGGLPDGMPVPATLLCSRVSLHGTGHQRSCRTCPQVPGHGHTDVQCYCDDQQGGAQRSPGSYAEPGRRKPGASGPH